MVACARARGETRGEVSAGGVSVADIWFSVWLGRRGSACPGPDTKVLYQKGKRTKSRWRRIWIWGGGGKRDARSLVGNNTPCTSSGSRAELARFYDLTRLSTKGSGWKRRNPPRCQVSQVQMFHAKGANRALHRSPKRSNGH